MTIIDVEPIAVLADQPIAVWDFRYYNSMLGIVCVINMGIGFTIIIMEAFNFTSHLFFSCSIEVVPIVSSAKHIVPLRL